MAHDSRYHPEWETVSRYVRELFNYHCARCNKDCRKTKNAQMVLQVHHIDENPANNALENLIPLCASCHLKIEGEARLHAPYREKQLELFEDHTYMSRMNEMRENRGNFFVTFHGGLRNLRHFCVGVRRRRSLMYIRRLS